MIHCQSCKIPKHVQVQIWTVNFLFMNSVFWGLKSAISAIFLTSTTCRNSKTQLASANHIYFFLGFWFTLKKKFSLQSLCLSQLFLRTLISVISVMWKGNYMHRLYSLKKTTHAFRVYFIKKCIFIISLFSISSSLISCFTCIVI